MNNARFEEGGLRPTYMSQVEANEVLELWAQRQREESSRPSLVTIHDVAEATQLPIEDVEKLLQEIRTRQPQMESVLVPPARVESSEPSLMAAYQRLSPILACISLFHAIYGFGNPFYMPLMYSLTHSSRALYFIYAFYVGIAYLMKASKRKKANKRSLELQRNMR